MTTEMKPGENSTAALMEVCGPLPAAMLSLVCEFIGQLQAVAHEHATEVTTLEARADALRVEIDSVVAKNTELETTIGTVGGWNQELEQEVASLRDMNAALIAERGALEAVEAAVARYAEQKRQVDALLQVAAADALQGLVPCAAVTAAADGGVAVASLDGDAGGPTSASSLDTASAVVSAVRCDASREIVASAERAGSAAGGRRILGSADIPR